MSEERQSESTPGREQSEPETRFSQEQYDMLKRCSDSGDVTQWNKWRRRQAAEEILLEEAHLEEARLRGAHLERAELRGAYLFRANLSRAHLEEANLRGANLRGAHLEEADLEGAHLEGAHLEEAHLKGANLAGAHLERAHLGEANLAGVNLAGAHMEEAHLVGAHMEEARLVGAHLQRAELFKANLSRARLRGAHLEEAHLKGANLEGAHLERAELSGANLSWARLHRAFLFEANFERTDLRKCTGIVFDSNHIVNARHIPANRWHKLRNQYTGVRLVFTLILLALFVAIYAAKAMFWYGVARGQDAAIEWVCSLEQSLEDRANVEDPNSLTPEEQRIREYALMTISWASRKLGEETSQRIERAGQNVAGRFRRWKVWHVLIGYDKGRWFSITAILLITYNVLRYVLTRFVGPLSEDEARSHYTPALAKYRWLVRLGRVTRLLGFFALASFVIHCQDWLTTEVYVPYRGQVDANEVSEQSSAGSLPTVREPSGPTARAGFAHGHVRPTSSAGYGAHPTPAPRAQAFRMRSVEQILVMRELMQKANGTKGKTASALPFAHRTPTQLYASAYACKRGCRRPRTPAVRHQPLVKWNHGTCANGRKVRKV